MTGCDHMGLAEAWLGPEVELLMPCDEDQGAQSRIPKAVRPGHSPSHLSSSCWPPAQAAFPLSPFPFSIRMPFSVFILRVWRDGTEGG